MDVTAWMFLILFVASMLAFGIYHATKIRSNNQYLLANRQTGLFALTATLVMTEFNTTTLIAYTSIGYIASWWGISVAFIFLIGLLFYAFTVAKKWKKFNGVSVADYFTERYGEKMGITAGTILFLAMTGFSATYIKSLTLIFQPLFPTINPWILSTALTLLTLLMTLRGGLVSIIRTDIVSFIATLIFIPLLLYFTYKAPIAHHTAHLSFAVMRQKLPVKFVLSLVFLICFSYILAPWYSQKIVAAKNQKVAYLSVIFAAILIFLLYGIAILTTALFQHKGYVLTSAQLALPTVISKLMPENLRGLDYGILFCIAATTLSGVWNAMVTLIIGKTEQRNIHKSMVLMLACAVLTLILANVFVDNVLNKMILANIPVVALSFALLAGFYWKRSTTFGAYLSIITGLVWGTACYLYFGNSGLYTWYWTVYGIPLIFIVGAIGSIKRGCYTAAITRTNKEKCS